MRGCGRAILTLCAVPSRASTDSAQRAAEGQRAAGTAERRACSSWQLQRYATRKKAARVNGSGKSPGCPRGVLACSSPAGFRQGGKRGLVAANVTSLPTQLISITHIHIQLSTNGHFVYAFLILRLLVFSGSFDRYSRFRTLQLYVVGCTVYRKYARPRARPAAKRSRQRSSRTSSAGMSVSTHDMTHVPRPRRPGPRPRSHVSLCNNVNECAHTVLGSVYG